MNRRWIHGKQFTAEYMEGVRQFMEFVGQKFGEDVPIHCPCRRCLNLKTLPQQEVHDHIHIFGMSSTYTRWIHHGESADGVEFEIAEDEVHETSNDGFGLDVIESDEEEDNGVADLIGDLYKAAEEDGEQPNFERVLEDAKQTLGPESKHSRLSFLVRMLHIKSFYRISNRGFSELLKLLSSAFPQCGIPKSYDESKKYLRELGLGYKSIHVCKNNCVLFRKDYADLEVCPKCGESRWEDADGNKRIPHKVLRHFPLIPRLKRIFATKATAESTQWHKQKRKQVDNEMSHPADGEAWKDFDRKYPSFAADARNLRLAVATDGFNPFGKISTTYSMWPVLIRPLSLPPWECMDESNCFMSLLIPGPTSPGKDMDLFLEPLIDELLELWVGVRTYDACSGDKFQLRAAVLWCIHDYPALSTLSGRTTRGYYACIHCDKNPLSRPLRNKIGYLGHRRYLPLSHRWRNSLAFDGRRERQTEPGKFSAVEVLEELEKVKDVTPGKEDKSKKRKRGGNEGKLPYWKDLLVPHVLDVMHIEKNICENIIATLLKIEGKTKDTINARLDLHDMGIRPNLHPHEVGNSVRIPQACYMLEKEKRIEFCNFLKSIKFPHGYASNLAKCISVDGSKVQGLKTHDCHVLLQRILRAGLWGFVEKEVYETIAELGKFFRDLCCKNLRKDVITRLKRDIRLILCKLEKIYPPAFFDVMLHLVVHLPDQVSLTGPVQYGWMYPIERRMGNFKNSMRNRARPEGSIAEAYLSSDTLTFCSRYIEDVETRFNRGARVSSGDGHLDDDTYVFMHSVKLMGGNRVQYIDDTELEKLVWYVLNNCEEVEPYVELFKKELERDGAHDVDKRLPKEFPKWFRSHIKELRRETAEVVSEGLYALSCGPDLRVKTCAACSINGIRYSTLDREKFLQTQNSGVMTEGTHEGMDIEFYGVLRELIELQYNSNLDVRRSVVLFRCDWYNQIGKTRGVRDDGHFKSINIQSFWYKSDPFILATQSKKIFYLPDTALGKDWRVVQKFEHRDLYNVSEKDDQRADVHQDDSCSDTEFEVQEGNVDEGLHSLQDDGEVIVIEGKLADLIRRKKQANLEDSDDEMQEDDTILQYCSDSCNIDADVVDSDGSNDD